MKMKSAIYASLALALPALLLNSPAHATDSKVYNAIACVESPNGEGHNFSRLPAGQVVNDSAELRSVSCPVMRDNTVDAWEGLDIWVVDNHAEQDVDCTLSAARSDGELYYVRTARTVGTGVQRMRIEGFQKCGGYGACIGDPPITRFYTLSCSVPGKYANKKSGIFYYVMHEQ